MKRTQLIIMFFLLSIFIYSQDHSFEEYLKNGKTVFKIEEVTDVDRIRIYIYSRIMYCIDNNKIDEANNLINLLETDEKLIKIPHNIEGSELYIQQLKERLSSI